MGRARDGVMVRLDYERTAREYHASLTVEDFMEGTAQAFQRMIFLVAFELIHAARAEIQFFNELLVQYDHGRPAVRRQVVPDNMVVLHHQPIQAEGSYDVPLQPERPFFVLEYVSPSNENKYYEESYDKYEQELRVPYYLIFYAQREGLSLYRLRGGRYVSVKPNAEGRYAIPQLELELGLVGNWVRFWFRGELMQMPSEIRAEREAARLERDEARVERDEARAEAARQRRARLTAEAEVERLRRQLGGGRA